MSETERLQLERLSIRSLQVLRAIIHNQIVQVPELKEGFEVPKSYKVAMDSVETVQKSLNSFGAALKVNRGARRKRKPCTHTLRRILLDYSTFVSSQ